MPFVNSTESSERTQYPQQGFPVQPWTFTMQRVRTDNTARLRTQQRDHLDQQDAYLSSECEDDDFIMETPATTSTAADETRRRMRALQ